MNAEIAQGRADTRIRLPLGRTVVTRGALEDVTFPEMMKALRRHATGDWGNVDKEDKATNDMAVTNGYRVLRAYTTQNGKKFWIITEADRSVTAVLLPEEY